MINTEWKRYNEYAGQQRKDLVKLLAKLKLKNAAFEEASYKGHWRRQGDSIQIQATFIQKSTNAPLNGPPIDALPRGLKPDLAKMHPDGMSCRVRNDEAGNQIVYIIMPILGW